jgi:hypothetical protein
MGQSPKQRNSHEAVQDQQKCRHPIPLAA